ncbi:MAG TPA: hypothetical protein VFJ53_08275, partial [Solirubrobacterales bacterium]|nr:hypothetical protein [Solirubrobacterales bacterium]
MKPPPVTLSGTVPTPADLDHEAIAAELEQSTAAEALEWMFENFGERQMPAYIPHIGGNYEGGTVAYGKRLKSRLPAKRVPEAVERWVRMYEADRNEGEEFNAFAERVGAEPF